MVSSGIKIYGSKWTKAKREDVDLGTYRDLKISDKGDIGEMKLYHLIQFQQAEKKSILE